MINPWIFEKNEQTKLQWFCSPYKNKENRWMMAAVFKSLLTGQLKEIYVPWGTLPYLRLGRTYVNKKMVESFDGNEDQLTLSDQYQYETVNSFAIPRKLWLLEAVFKYGIQKILRFEVNNHSYYLPYLELIRSFLTPTKLLTNTVLTPYGIDLLLENPIIREHTLSVGISDAVPSTYINNANIMHLIWLMYDSTASLAWKSIYEFLYKEAVMRNEQNPGLQLGKGIPLECSLPFSNCKISYRGVSFGRHTLILEILKNEGTSFPFEEIEYSHVSLKSIKANDSGETKTRNQVIKKSTDESKKEITNTDEPANESTYNETVKVPPISFGYEFRPKVSKIRSGERSKIEIDLSVINEKTKNVGTTQDVEAGGRIPSFEFENLEVRHNVQGLEEFLQTIEIVAEKQKIWDVSIKIGQLPEGEKVSNNPDGTRRSYALIDIIAGSVRYFIIEIARPDNWPVATLIFRSLEPKKTDDFIGITEKLLLRLISNNGHWDSNLLDQEKEYVFERIKHTQPNRHLWAEKIANKVKKL